MPQLTDCFFPPLICLWPFGQFHHNENKSPFQCTSTPLLQLLWWRLTGQFGRLDITDDWWSINAISTMLKLLCLTNESVHLRYDLLCLMSHDPIEHRKWRSLLAIRFAHSTEKGGLDGPKSFQTAHCKPNGHQWHGNKSLRKKHLTQTGLTKPTFRHATTPMAVVNRD